MPVPKSRILSHEAPSDLSRLLDMVERGKRHDKEAKRRGEGWVLARRDARPFQRFFIVAARVMADTQQTVVDVELAVERRQPYPALRTFHRLSSAPEIAHRTA